MIPLRHVLEQALVDGLIEKNPLDKVLLNKILPKSSNVREEVDPFDEEEIKQILSRCIGQVKNLFQFAFFSGLRTSELIALQWDHIDFNKGIVHVQQAQVARQLKVPKTKAGFRDVILLPPALEALENQKQYTYSTKKLTGKRVFLNPYTQKPWCIDRQIRRYWIRALNKNPKMRYRKPYNTRHTFASMLLSRGENIWFLATQLGHRNTEMIQRHYGKWIKDNSESTGYKFKADWNLDLTIKQG